MTRIGLSSLLLLALCTGPARAGTLDAALRAELPTGVELVAVEVDRGVLRLVLDGAIEQLRGRELAREDLVRDLLWAGRGVRPGLAGIELLVERGGRRRPLWSLLRDPREAAVIAALRARGRPPPERVLRGLPPEALPYGGSLLGRTIALSPGHGWSYDGGWRFQRPLIDLPGCTTCLGIIEDLSNAQIVNRYLIPHLLRAGASVWSVRERDPSSFERVVEADDAAVIAQGPWQPGDSPGGLGDDYRVLPAEQPGRLLFPLEPDVPGRYWVSLWQVAGDNRVAAARVRIHHRGGTAVLQLDQRQNGSRWIHLGRWRFGTKGGALELSAGPGAEPGQYLIADAVRLGGGFDEQPVADQPANKPRWMMNALLGLPYLGLPDWAATGSDVTVRPAYAEWQGADAYLSLHSNASGGSTSAASGTSTYRFSCLDYPDHSAAPDPARCDDPPGSDALQRALHQAIIDTLRDRWDPNWRDRGRLVANFGEMRVLDSIPGALVESAFHDGVERAGPEMRMPDNQALQDPRFRRWLGYALYAGLVRFFDPAATLLPAERPRGLSLVHAAGGGLRASWQPVAGASGYRVRWGLDTRALGPGAVVEQTELHIDAAVPGQLVAVQVAALNAGGEGPPSELAAARYRGHGCPADVLLVAGFDRQDAFIGDWRNRRDQAWAHAQAVAGLEQPIYLDFAANECVADGRVALADYAAAVWILGEESTADETFAADEQAAVRAYLDSGGALLASGAEIGWDLVERGDGADSAFFAASFGARYAADDAETFAAAGAGAFAALGALAFDDGAAGIYPVEYPDVLEPAGGEQVLVYDNGAGAAVAWQRDPGRSLLLGFPLETIVEPAARSRLADLALAFLLPELRPDDYDGDGLPDAWEHHHGTDPLQPSADADPDGDGLSNAEEYARGSDPQRAEGGDDGGSGDGGAPAGGGGGGCGCSSSSAPGAGGCGFFLLGLARAARRRRAAGHRDAGRPLSI